MNNRPKIFVIGFNSCGTTSLHRLFLASGLRSVHWKAPDGRNLAAIMQGNLSAHHKLLTGITDFDVYSDLFYLSDEVLIEANVHFKTLDRQEPGAKFILNTRDKKNWLISRLNHSGKTQGSLLARAMTFHRATERQVAKLWSDQWDKHHEAVRNHFADRPADFLEFNIERDPVSRLARFLQPVACIAEEEWKAHNVTQPPGHNRETART